MVSNSQNAFKRWTLGYVVMDLLWRTTPAARQFNQESWRRSLIGSSTSVFIPKFSGWTTGRDGLFFTFLLDWNIFWSILVFCVCEKNWRTLFPFGLDVPSNVCTAWVCFMFQCVCVRVRAPVTNGGEKSGDRKKAEAPSTKTILRGDFVPWPNHRLISAAKGPVRCPINKRIGHREGK